MCARRHCWCCSPKKAYLKYVKGVMDLLDEGKLPPAGQYMSDGNARTWTEKEIQEAKQKVETWEAKKAEETAAKSPIGKATAELTKTASSVGAFFANAGSAVASAIPGNQGSRENGQGKGNGKEALI